MSKLEWNVYKIDSQNKLIPFNIFDHWKFKADILDLKLKNEDFSKQVERCLFRYFCGKYEYEIEISPLLDNRNVYKVDIYSQIMLNFDKFVDYLRGKF